MRDFETPERTRALSDLALELLRRHDALPSPENYELWFAYAARRNDGLVRELDKLVNDGTASDSTYTRKLHVRFFASAPKGRFSAER